MKFDFDYKEFIEKENSISPVEAKIIDDFFQTLLEGNDCFQDISAQELKTYFWLFKHGWICRSMIT